MTEQKERFPIWKELTKRQKYFQLLGVPILIYIGLYLSYQLLIYLFHIELQDPVAMEVLPIAIGTSIGHWIILIYPAKTDNDSNKPKKGIKEYIKQYVIKGTAFQRGMFILYSLCAMILIIIVWLTITGRL